MWPKQTLPVLLLLAHKLFTAISEALLRFCTAPYSVFRYARNWYYSFTVIRITTAREHRASASVSRQTLTNLFASICKRTDCDRGSSFGVDRDAGSGAGSALK